MIEVAQRYGFTPNKVGFISCPFHLGDHKPSLKLYSKGRGWHCFSCNRGGSVIDFTAELFNLTPLAAVERLNTDFGLGLPLHRKPTLGEMQAVRRQAKQAETYKDFQKWKNSFLDKLSNAYREGHLALKEITDPNQLTDREILAIKWQPFLNIGVIALTTAT